MIKNDVFNSEIIKKLFKGFQKDKWVKEYFETFLKNNMMIKNEFEIEKIEDEKIIFDYGYGVKIEFYINNYVSENILFTYKIITSIKDETIYGIIIKDKDQIMDLYCFPHRSIKTSKADFQGSLYKVNTKEQFSYSGILNRIIENNMTEGQFNDLIKEMLKRENLLVKNTLMRLF